LGEIAVERRHQRLVAEPVLQARRRPGDFRLSGQECQDRAALGPMRLDDRPRHRVLDPLAGRPILIADIDRESASQALYDRRLVEQRHHAGHIERCRHHQNPEILAQRRLHVERQRQPEIRIQRALVKFVEDHGGDPGQFGIVEDHSREHAFRHHLDPCARRNPGVEPHPVTDRLADDFPEQGCHPPARSPRCQPSWFEQNDPAVAAPVLVQQVERHQRRLAGAGRGRKHGAPPAL
jgi:hypothetical protein